MEQAQQRRTWQLSTYQLTVAGVFGALAIVLSFTPLGLIPIPNPTGAATTLHLPAIIAGILAGPVVGALVGLVLAVSSWLNLGASTFIPFAGGNVFVALLSAFLPRVLIGVVAYYVYRALRRQPSLAAVLAALAGTLTNTIGLLGIITLLGAPPIPPFPDPSTMLAPAFSMNFPLEAILAIVITLPTIAVLRARRPNGVAAARD